MVDRSLERENKFEVPEDHWLSDLRELAPASGRWVSADYR